MLAGHPSAVGRRRSSSVVGVGHRSVIRRPRLVIVGHPSSFGLQSSLAVLGRLANAPFIVGRCWFPVVALRSPSVVGRRSSRRLP